MRCGVKKLSGFVCDTIGLLVFR